MVTKKKIKQNRQQKTKQKRFQVQSTLMYYELFVINVFFLLESEKKKSRQQTNKTREKNWLLNQQLGENVRILKQVFPTNNQKKKKTKKKGGTRKKKKKTKKNLHKNRKREKTNQNKTMTKSIRFCAFFFFFFSSKKKILSDEKRRGRKKIKKKYVNICKIKLFVFFFGGRRGGGRDMKAERSKRDQKKNKTNAKLSIKLLLRFTKIEHLYIYIHTICV
ncbi:hypothetical protein RFI_11624 [Reticulomyxa filosa]|uniref:Uncharacterized protein n=1 Tax=Reticulomyxa filosa TaxID=46433 RepID=X6NIH2_RETFI|nr:hypothetical protein RFI_11624 [Reticulomyxa filosa]|eukprot:ETO25514.1 hypothetical protein RFI_11624 [Reticulomyxa filosa]